LQTIDPKDFAIAGCFAAPSRGGKDFIPDFLQINTNLRFLSFLYFCCGIMIPSMLPQDVAHFFARGSCGALYPGGFVIFLPWDLHLRFNVLKS
jgi:hypothetical protein